MSGRYGIGTASRSVRIGFTGSDRPTSSRKPCAVPTGKRALANAGTSGPDVARYVPHQANLRIIEAVAARLDIAEDRVEVDLVDRANTSAASIPLALHRMAGDGRVEPGDLVLLGAVGAGMGYGSLALRWGR